MPSSSETGLFNPKSISLSHHLSCLDCSGASLLLCAANSVHGGIWCCGRRKVFRLPAEHRHEHCLSVHVEQAQIFQGTKHVNRSLQVYRCRESPYLVQLKAICSFWLPELYVSFLM